MNNKNLANKIKQLRKERAWSQAQLAEIASLSIRTIQRAEKLGSCSYETLLAIASAFDIDVRELTALSAKISKTPANEIVLFGIKIRTPQLNSRKSFLLGIIIMLPAVYFLVANVLKYNFGISFMHDSLNIVYSNESVFKIFNSISPFIFLGGLLVALAVNMLTMLSINIESAKGTLKSSMALTPRLANMVIVIISLLAFSLMFGYAVVENLVPH